MTTKLEEQIFNHLKQNDAPIDYSTKFKGSATPSPPMSRWQDSNLHLKYIRDIIEQMNPVSMQKTLIENDDFVTLGDIGRVMFGIPKGLPEKGLTKSQKWLIDRLNNLGDMPMTQATAIKRLAEFLSPFTNEVINRTKEVSDKLGEVPGEIQDIPSEILNIIDESLESGTLKPIGDKRKREYLDSRDKSTDIEL